MNFRNMLAVSFPVFMMLVTLSASAATTTYDFARVTTKAPANLGTQLTMEVTDAGAGQATFTLYNEVGVKSAITAVYFDWGTATPFQPGGFVITDSGSGVSFSEGAAPANLPAGRNIGFIADYAADSNTPRAWNGVGRASEWVSFLGMLAPGLSYSNVIDYLNTGLLRVGLHVQAIRPAGYTTNFSDSYVNSLNPVPLPAAAWLFATALIGFVMASSRRRV